MAPAAAPGGHPLRRPLVLPAPEQLLRPHVRLGSLHGNPPSFTRLETPEARRLLQAASIRELPFPAMLIGRPHLAASAVPRYLAESARPSRRSQRSCRAQRWEGS